MHGDFVQKISDYLTDNADYYDERDGNIEHLKKFVQSQSFGKTFDEGRLNNYYDDVFKEAFDENSVRNSHSLKQKTFQSKMLFLVPSDQFNNIEDFKEEYISELSENPFDDLGDGDKVIKSPGIRVFKWTK